MMIAVRRIRRSSIASMRARRRPCLAFSSDRDRHVVLLDALVISLPLLIVEAMLMLTLQTTMTVVMVVLVEEMASTRIGSSSLQRSELTSLLFSFWYLMPKVEKIRGGQVFF
jgi:hypothetical protein